MRARPELGPARPGEWGCCFPPPQHPLALPRSFLHARLRTATLRHDADGQATLLNLLLRNYLHYNLYDQAEKLVSKSVFPEQANNNEWARYLYYTGEARGVCARDRGLHFPREPVRAAGDGASRRDLKPHPGGCSWVLSGFSKRLA